MDSCVLEYVQVLQQNVAELHQMGKEWGMTEEEMSACIERVLKEDENVVVAPPPTFTLRRILRCVPVAIFFLFVTILVIACGAMVLFYVYPPAWNYVSGALKLYDYKLLRAVRLAALPLHRYFNITSLYDAECIVGNPWFEGPSKECIWCRDVHKFEILNDTTDQDLITNYLREARPMVFQGLAKKVTFDDLRQLYRNNKDVLDTAAVFQSNVPGMKNIEDLFIDEIDEDFLYKDKTTIHWTTKNIPSSQVMRKLFPRPSFIPSESEVALDKVVFVDGHKSGHYEVTTVRFEMGYYMQLSSSRKVIVTPSRHCREVCSPMHTLMNEGDIMTYNPLVWRAVMMPNVDNMLSIGYLGSYSFAGLKQDEINPEDQPPSSHDWEKKE
eukprot:XP_011420653.1 PREDICTED: uncharacterized protein LOC105323278 isoform X1 [Crassostrea gigas]